MKLDTTATNSNSTQRIVSFQTSCCWRLTPAALSHYQCSLKDVLLGEQSGPLPQFFHQLLMHWIIHAVLSLMPRLVHIFPLLMLSFVSTSSMTVSCFPLAHHRFHLTNRRLVSYLVHSFPDSQSTFYQICMIDQSSTHFPDLSCLSNLTCVGPLT